jgi:hypothetical protein
LSKRVKVHLEDGKKIRFWHAVWLRDCPLHLKYEKLYNICSQQHWEVARVLRGGVINLTFRRNFGAHERMEWEELERELEGIELNDDIDSVRWMLTMHGGFNNASLYSCYCKNLYPPSTS